ncbi:MAG TPA: hypothetical protein VKV04_00540 [Verrucomicrobiae bacterium]|nr:hypothetical protein [Verrucomicrobiae bacterium]
MKQAVSHLQIRVHQLDGSLTTFTQSDSGRIKQLLDGFQPAQIFRREKIVLADRNSHTTFSAAQVTRIDLDPGEQALLVFPTGLVEAVELTSVEFEALIRNPVMREQWTLPGARDESVVAFLDVQMADGRSVLLTSEVNWEPSAGLPDLNTSCLSGSGLCFRMRTGGIAALNLANLTRLTLYPGPLEMPADAWHARFLHTTLPARPAVAGDAGTSVPGNPPPIPFFPQTKYSNDQRK